MSRSKHKSSGDIAGTTVVFKILYCKVKNVLFFVHYVKSIINLFQYNVT